MENKKESERRKENRCLDSGMTFFSSYYMNFFRLHQYMGVPLSLSLSFETCIWDCFLFIIWTLYDSFPSSFCYPINESYCRFSYQFQGNVLSIFFYSCLQYHCKVCMVFFSPCLLTSSCLCTQESGLIVDLEVHHLTAQQVALAGVLCVCQFFNLYIILKMFSIVDSMCRVLCW